MNRYMHNLVSRLPHPGKWIFWIFVALLFKSALFIYKVNEPTNFPNSTYTQTFARETGDCRSYIDPIETYLKDGRYYSELTFYSIGTEVQYGDYRMPGYGAVYYLLRLFLEQAAALNALVMLQLILSSVSVYVLALLALRIFKSNSYFYVTYFLYLTSSFVSLNDQVLATESFCVAALIFSLYFLTDPSKKKTSLILSGLFLTWCIFLRPVMVPLLILFMLYLLLFDGFRLRLTSERVVKILIFLVPFILIDGYWIYRNYVHHKGIYPLTVSPYYHGVEDSILGSVFKFMQSYGGSIVWWKSTNEINYFMPKSEVTGVEFPGSIFNNTFNMDSLALVRKLIVEVEQPGISADEYSAKTERVKGMLNRFAESIRENNSFTYYIGSRIKCLKSFLVHSGSNALFEKPASQLSIPQMLLKLYSSVLYWLILIAGFAGCVLLLLNFRDHPSWVFVTLICLYLSFVFPLLLKLDEVRYFVPAYAMLVLPASYIILHLTRIFRRSGPLKNI